ncbi:hypothetical protein [Methylobacterium nodulans]|uniref:Uncharacterized protein n=1 Tax=Methylobacterium nodulans (strain LMG 21967 / CNCM I-2342 / ORS 2060) TaxID=460265 RepID=B8IKY4_METNO|nr:hypothetical protein [Methylobacterium nodulans]ACL58172.1 hypothetical protein Mnod_3248 [Methylobacterium nodulans ORS 2060]
MGGSFYEFSVYATGHRCAPQMYVQFLDAAGNHVAYAGGVVGANNQGIQGGALKDYPRLGFIAQAPSTATQFRVMYRGVNITGDGPIVMLAGMMYAGARSDQTECSPYTPPGVTLIDGGTIMTHTIAADRLVARSITAGQIAVGAITATEIAGSTITGGNIAARTITAANIVGRSITAWEIATNTITANQIAGQTITGWNIASNTISADKLVANSITAGQIAAGAIGVDQLAAGAITADKIGVGLNSTNLLYNSDFRAGVAGHNGMTGPWPPGIYGTWSNYDLTGHGHAPYIGLNQSGAAWQPNGMGSLQVSCTGTPLRYVFGGGAAACTCPSVSSHAASPVGIGTSPEDGGDSSVSREQAADERDHRNDRQDDAGREDHRTRTLQHLQHGAHSSPKGLLEQRGSLRPVPGHAAQASAFSRTGPFA